MDMWKTEEDILKDVETYAASYTPEWEFSLKNPDAGSTIAAIFASQMGRNIREFNGILDRCRLEFVNLLGLSLLPAVPAKGVVTMELAAVTDGVKVPARTKLLADTGEGEPVVFETVDDLFVTGSKLTDVLEISGKSGRIIPWMGGACPASILEKEKENRKMDFTPFTLFEYGAKGIGENALLLYHETMLNRPGEKLYLNVRGGMEEELAKWEFLYLCAGSLEPVEFLCRDGNRFIFEMNKRPDKTRYGGREYGLLYIRRPGPVECEVRLNNLMFSGGEVTQRPEFLCCNDEELTGESFYPLGERIALYDEFYIGSSQMFSRSGSRICIKFQLRFEEYKASLSALQEEFQLKTVRRKLPETVRKEFYKARADTVSITYFNGTGWRKLDCGQNLCGLFSGEMSGNTEISFICPWDWKETIAGGYEGLVLRVQVTRADYCYLLPCIHRVPVMSGLEIHSSYEGVWEKPDRIRTLHETEITDVTAFWHEKGQFMAFRPPSFKEDGLYLGFHQKFVDGPVSLLLQLREQADTKGIRLRYEYSSPHGFKTMQMIDNTDFLRASGTLIFMPPPDMDEMRIAGLCRFWLRLLPVEDEKQDGSYPVLEKVTVNAADVWNVETRMEEEYELDTAGQNMEFPLGGSSILDAEVYVNEKSSLSVEVMKQMIREKPENVRVSYDPSGEIQTFYVKWTEIDDFCHSGSNSRNYTLDRLGNVLRFGDGVRGKIPGGKDKTVFTVALRYCEGERGNVASDVITGASSNLILIGDVRNPFPTYGGSGREDLEHVCMRGAALLNARKRLISGRDYIREALASSDHVGRAACVTEGNKIKLILLMKDYKEGAPSFRGVRDRLFTRIRNQCSAACQIDDLEIREPVFIRMNVEVWVRVQDEKRSMEIQQKICHALERFIEPLTGGTGEGFTIGALPRENQFAMMLHSVKYGGYMTHFTVTAVYEDENGRYCMGIGELRDNPIAVGAPGILKVHVRTEDGMGGNGL